MNPLVEIGPVANMLIELEVELDRKQMRIREILGLEAGSILKMTRSAGDNIDILVSGILIGSGEIVIVEDAIGIRVTDFRSVE